METPNVSPGHVSLSLDPKAMETRFTSDETSHLGEEGVSACAASLGLKVVGYKAAEDTSGCPGDLEVANSGAGRGNLDRSVVTTFGTYGSANLRYYSLPIMNVQEKKHNCSRHTHSIFPYKKSVIWLVSMDRPQLLLLILLLVHHCCCEL